MLLADGFSFSQPFENAFSTLMQYIPRLIGALIILLVGYIVAKVIGKLITTLLEKIHFNQTMERANLQQFLDRAGADLTPSSLLGKVVFWFVFIITLTMFASALGVPQISGFLNKMVGYIPNVFAAILIVFLAMLFGRFLAGIVRGFTGSAALGKATNLVIVIYAVFVALVQLHIAQQLTGPTFLIVLAGLALAFGLSFGLGGREQAKQMIERFASSSSQQQRPTQPPQQPPE
ncbi:MAG: mechanosensitive ion channel family protein [Nocardioidaceae bacterium]